MIYKKCTRCGIKLKRTRMTHKRISFSGGQLMKHKYAFCKKHMMTKSFMEAKWADSMHQLMPDHSLLFKKIGLTSSSSGAYTQTVKFSEEKGFHQ